MTFQVRNPIAAGASQDTVVGFKTTQLDLRKPAFKPLEIKHISDAGVEVCARTFGFTEEIIRDQQCTDMELKTVVSYVFFAMRKVEDREMNAKMAVLKQINRENDEGLFFRDLYKYVKKGFLGIYLDSRLPVDIDNGDPKKKMERQLRDGLCEDGLPVSRTTKTENLFKIVLERIRDSGVTVIEWKSPTFR